MTELLRYGNAETSLKEVLCSSGGEMQTQNFNIYDINEEKQYKLINIHLLHNWINKLFSEENKVPRTLFEARKWGRVHHMWTE